MRAILFALGANVGIGLSKAGAACYTGSGAMLAEAIHSVADCTNQALLRIGLKRARKPVTEEHPLGHGKAIYFWLFLVALLQFSMGGMFPIYEGVHKLLHPELPRAPWVAVAVLVVAILLEAGALRAALQEVRRVQGRRTFVNWFRSSRQSELIVVVGEDIAALIGLVLALAAVVATMLSDNPLFDALGTIAIGAVLVLIAVAVGVEVKGLRIGESADPQEVAAMRQWLEARPDVARVYRLITLQLGLELTVSVKARVRATDAASRLITDINRVERELRATFPKVRWVFFEPDRRD